MSGNRWRVMRFGITTRVRQVLGARHFLKGWGLSFDPNQGTLVNAIHLLSRLAKCVSQPKHFSWKERVWGCSEGQPGNC